MNDANLTVIKLKHMFQKYRIYVYETGCNHIKLVPYVNTICDAELLRYYNKNQFNGASQIISFILLLNSLYTRSACDLKLNRRDNIF